MANCDKRMQPEENKGPEAAGAEEVTSPSLIFDTRLVLGRWCLWEPWRAHITYYHSAKTAISLDPDEMADFQQDRRFPGKSSAFL